MELVSFLSDSSEFSVVDCQSYSHHYGLVVKCTLKADVLVPSTAVLEIGPLRSDWVMSSLIVIALVH